MASYPEFDPQLFVGVFSEAGEIAKYEALDSEGSNSPLNNRAIFRASARPHLKAFYRYGRSRLWAITFLDHLRRRRPAPETRRRSDRLLAELAPVQQHRH